MKYLLLILSLALSLAAQAAAPTASDLLNDSSTGADITTYGMGYDLQRHSPLKQIDRETVRRLVPVWSLSLANNFPQETQPLVVGGTLYATTVDATVAVDAATGKQLWRTPVKLPQDVFAI
ncbi:MAG TPA: PQQ-binding-like beta-propeller repeat protein, partial [Steroidobacteraceae bacterium]|nr:PQQ-binding-like beta-propeller repeat protein [Steroidobacteraceae bacterium]